MARRALVPVTPGPGRRLFHLGSHAAAESGWHIGTVPGGPTAGGAILVRPGRHRTTGAGEAPAPGQGSGRPALCPHHAEGSLEPHVHQA